MPTPEARIFARNALADDPGELDEDWLADQLDRFAAHSGAEAQAEADRLRADVDRLAEERYQAIIERDKALAVVPEYPKRSYMADFGEGAPPQTGGGDAPDLYDAPERAAIKEQLKAGNALMRDAARERGYELHSKLTGGGDAGERAREDEDDVRRGGPEYFRAALQESRREGHREGAEAMREAAARQRDDRAADALDSGQPAIADLQKLAAAETRALPIPGKTDAG